VTVNDGVVVDAVSEDQPAGVFANQWRIDAQDSLESSAPRRSAGEGPALMYAIAGVRTTLDDVTEGM
jgi:hypothetical protein